MPLRSTSLCCKRGKVINVDFPDFHKHEHLSYRRVCELDWLPGQLATPAGACAVGSLLEELLNSENVGANFQFAISWLALN